MTFHKFGFTNAKYFFQAQLFEGWEPTDNFYQLVGDYCSDVEPEQIQNWIDEWHEDNKTD